MQPQRWTGRRAGVVRGERERHGPELAQEVVHQVGLRVDGLRGVHRVAQPVRGGRARHELRDAARARRRDGVRVEPGLGRELRGEQRGGHVPPPRRVGEGPGEAGGHVRRHAALPVGRPEADAAGAGGAHVPEVPGLPAVALAEPEPLGVRGEPAVGGVRAEVELGAEAVQRPARRGDPLRVGPAGEQRGLLGVRPVRADHDERDAVAPGAASSRSNASATSGRIGLPCRCANGPRYSSPVGAATSSAAGGASSASASASTATRSSPTPIEPRVVTRMRTGANVSASGNATSARSAPLRRATSAAALVASAR
jgi:hypothetical protein